MPHVLQGSIVRANVIDPQGGNPKVRPLVIVTATSEISQSGQFVAVAITEQVADPLSDEVSLQWHPQRRCRTRLVKPSIAKCSWLRALTMADIVDVKGHVPTAELESILEKLATLDRKPEASTPVTKPEASTPVTNGMESDSEASE